MFKKKLSRFGVPRSLWTSRTLHFFCFGYNLDSLTLCVIQSLQPSEPWTKRKLGLIDMESLQTVSFCRRWKTEHQYPTRILLRRTGSTPSRLQQKSDFILRRQEETRSAKAALLKQTQPTSTEIISIRATSMKRKYHHQVTRQATTTKVTKIQFKLIGDRNKQPTKQLTKYQGSAAHFK